MVIQRWLEKPEFRKIIPYDPIWKKIYSLIESELIDNDDRYKVFHIGSTSIIGCSAKPMIDIMVAVEKNIPYELIVNRLIQIGFHSRDVWVDTKEKPYLCGHLLFGDTGYNINIHITHFDSKDYKNFIKFRDVLMNDPSLIQEYIGIKQLAYAKTQGNAKEYNAIKDSFIQRILNMGVA